MGLVERLEAGDRIGSQFSRFVVIGGISTLINYAVFLVLYAMLSVNYLVASAAGYVVGAVFGYYFNARLTFRSRPGLSVMPYFAVYLFSLVAGLGVLRFFSVSAGIEPLFSNVISIAFTAAANFLGCRYLVFGGLKIPSVFKSKAFLSVLALKIIFAFLLASDFMTQLFIPFVQYFVGNPLSNPYQHFIDIGNVKAFPYPPFMLLVVSVPYMLFGVFSGPFFELFAMRIPLLAADIAIFYVLYRILDGKKVMLLYWASPVVFYITYIHGQLDIIPVALLFLSAYFLKGRQYVKSAALLGAGIAAKSFVFVALPLYLAYLIKKKIRWIGTAAFFAISLGMYAAFLVPFVFSEGFVRMVFGAEEQFRLFNLSVDLTLGLVYYIVPAAYAYILFKAFSFKRMTSDMLFVLLGMTLTFLVTFIHPERGWYMWAIPFVIYFLVKERISVWIYSAFNAAYLLYFLFVPDSDVFRVFQVVWPSISSLMTPYYMLVSAGIPSDILVNVLFTAMTSALLYLTYIIYRRGVRSGLLFQEKNGIPIIGIGGDSGSGKTTLAKTLSELFGRERVTTVYGDDIHRWERKDSNWEKYTHLNPAGNRIYLNYRQIRKLKGGATISRPHYDHGTGKFTSPSSIKPRDIIISEGLHTFFISESNSIYEIKAFLDPDPSLRVLWKLRRDMKLRGYSKKEVMKKLGQRRRDSDRFIAPQKMYADMVISYMPEGKVSFSDIENDVPVRLQIDVKNDIPLEGFLEAASGIKSLGIEMEYHDHRFQRMVFRGGASVEDIGNLLNSLDIDYETYEIDRNGIRGGFDGILQVIFLYCLNERLKVLGGGGDE